MSKNIPQNLVYSHKLKGVGLCFKLLRSALCSNMANFGVFKLYNDKALENAFEVGARSDRRSNFIAIAYFLTYDVDTTGCINIEVNIYVLTF